MTSRQEGRNSSEDGEDGWDSSEESPTTDESPTNIFASRAFTDPVFVHLSRTLSARELVRLKPVCKQIAPLLSGNNIFTAMARSQDDFVDCYFPLDITRHFHYSSPNGSSKRQRVTSFWEWSGVHHPTREIHNLPSLEYFMSIEVTREHDLGTHVDSFLPTSGSLLLLTLKATNQKHHGAWNNTNRLMYTRHKKWPGYWMPLLVSNPLTQEYRVLPKPANANSTSWNYSGARAHLVEDEIASTYRILLVFRDSIFVYESTTKCWSSSILQDDKLPIYPWGVIFQDVDDNICKVSYYYDVPCAIWRGRLWYAELEVDGDTNPDAHADENDDIDTVMLTKGGVKVYKVDDERGTWKVARYALKDFIPTDLHDANTLGFGFRQGSYAIEMVNCMGGVYILIPAILDVFMAVGENIKQLYELTNDIDKSRRNVTYEDFGFLNIRFYVLQLEGDGLPFGQALARFPPGSAILNEQDSENEYSTGEMEWNPHEAQNPSNWYYTRGFGSVISIVFERYLLQYNVVSGVSTTKVLTNSRVSYNPDVSYTPSFCISP